MPSSARDRRIPPNLHRTAVVACWKMWICACVGGWKCWMMRGRLSRLFLAVVDGLWARRVSPYSKFWKWVRGTCCSTSMIRKVALQCPLISLPPEDSNYS